MITTLRKGALNTVVDGRMSTSLSDNKKNFIITDANVDYDTVASDINNGKKKLLLFDNDVSSDGFNSNLVYESNNLQLESTIWIYDNFQDGWFTPYLFYVESYTDTLSNVTVRDGVIIYYENTGNSNNVDSGFYRYVQEGEGYNVTIAGPTAIEIGNTSWKLAEVSDWMDFARLILEKPSQGYTFLGELGMQQNLLTSYLEKALAIIVINDSISKVKCSNFVEDYQRLHLMIEGIKARFNQGEFIKSQEILETAIEFTEELNCYKYDIYR